MREITSVDRLEAIVGAPRPMILMKTVRALDDGCRSILAHSPVAWFGFRDATGRPMTTLVGGRPGFARAESPTRLEFDLPAGERGPVTGSGVSFVFLLPGVGETLRLNGAVAQSSGTRVAVDVEEIFVHCARSILRSGLWKSRGEGAPAPGGTADFLAASPFAAVSTWDADGSGDTSPRGDHPGFLRMLDDTTLALPDRRGNQRTDTFHNILACDSVALAAVVPGRSEILHLDGTASVTDEPRLLATMAVGGRPPGVALLVRVRRAEIRPNEALRESRLWEPSSHVDRALVPDLMRLAAQHLASNGGTVARALSKAPGGLIRRGIDISYRRQLRDEGY